ncbi:fibronectin type III domain-containing protein [Paenibacillus sp. 481]|nr:fibronectin type III domain-containing protein [Paenibacillus sp. 481]
MCVLVLSLIPVTAFGTASPETPSAAAPAAWAPNTAYKIGDLVTYQNKSYECTLAHTSLVGWEPAAVPALWKVSTSQPPVDITPPTAPQTLQATAVTHNSVTLSWQAATDNVGVTSYHVWNGTLKVGTSASTTFTASGLTANTNYTFSVQAADAAGNVSPASNIITISTPGAPNDVEAPSIPANVQLTDKTSTSLTITWNASTDNIAVTQYEVLLNGQLAGTTSSTTWTAAGLTASTAYSLVVRALDAAGNRSGDSAVVTATTNPTNPGTSTRKLIGYWHNFNNGSANIRLKDVSPHYDIINVAFAEPIAADRATMGFTPYNATKEQFIADIAALKAQGKKVNISIGGADGAVELVDNAARLNFTRTMTAIINEYGFSGIDIDLEGSSLALNGGDTDFRNPTTPKIANLIASVREILSQKGPDFLLTMAPETAYVQGGMTAYGGPWGAYLPVIYAFKDRLNIIHVQHYNTGGITALDGRTYSQGTPDFQVAMTEMLLQGFPIANNQANKFPALRADQVGFGLPSIPRAAPAGGYTTPADIDKALKYLVKGQSYGGAYVLRNPAGYSAFPGVMTWSINWDQVSGFGFSQPVRNSLNSL